MRLIDGKPVPESAQEAFSRDDFALIIVDVQNDYCCEGGHFHRVCHDLTMIREMLPNLSRLIDAARGLNVPCIYTQQTTLAGGCSDSPAWLFFKVRGGGSPHSTLLGSWGHRFVEGFEPKAEDIVVQKHRSSAFVNTSLDLVLRARGVRSVAVCGVTTEGCVESTLRHAAFLDYFVCLVEDCCASDSVELHDCSVKVTRARHPVVTGQEIVEMWSRSIRGT